MSQNEHSLSQHSMSQETIQSDAPVTLTVVDMEEKNNALVAETDFQAFSDFMEARKAEVAQTEPDLLMQKYKRTMLTLFMNHAEQMCQPVKVKALFLYRKALEEKMMREDDDDDSNHAEPMEYDLDDFDSDELLHYEYQTQLRNLREQVRQQANRVAQVRGEVIDQMTEITQQQIKSLEDSMAAETDAATATQDPHQDEQQHKENLQTIEMLNQKMKQVQLRLKETDEQLPGAVEKWQRQLEAIQVGEQWSLSQTEQTVRHRTKETILPETTPLTADERLLQFLS